MTIAIVLPRGSRFDATHPNSVETVVSTINVASADRDHIVVVTEEGAEVHGPFATHVIPRSRSKASFARAVKCALRRLNPALTEFHQTALTFSDVARSFPDTPSIFYRHNFSKVPTGWARKLWHRRIHRAFDARVFVSDDARRAFVAGFPSLAATTVAIPNPVDPTLWYAPVARHTKLIAFAGRAAPEKGFAELCAGLATVLDRHPDWSVRLYGSEWAVHADWAREQARALDRFGDRGRVLPNQPITAVRALLQQAEIAVVPSIWAEPFGLAAVEAHMAGAAVVSSGTGGLREASGDHAHYVDAITPRNLATAISGLIDDPGGRWALAERGQRFALATHTPERRAATLDALRAQVIAQHKRAPWSLTT